MRAHWKMVVVAAGEVAVVVAPIQFVVAATAAVLQMELGVVVVAVEAAAVVEAVVVAFQNFD